MASHSPAATSPASPPASDPLSVRPFFENKARAFWTLQAAGWSGYLVLRSVVGISNGFSLEKIIPVIIEAILGYCITLLLSTLYGYYRRIPRSATTGIACPPGVIRSFRNSPLRANRPIASARESARW